MKSAADEAGGRISDDERECAVRAGWRLETPNVQRHLKVDQRAYPSHSFARASLDKEHPAYPFLRDTSKMTEEKVRPTPSEDILRVIRDDVTPMPSLLAQVENPTFQHDTIQERRLDFGDISRDIKPNNTI